MSREETIEFLEMRGHEDVAELSTDEILDILEMEDEDYYNEVLDYMMMGIW